MSLNKLKYLRNDNVMGGAKCTARTARARTPLPYTTIYTTISIFSMRQCRGDVLLSMFIVEMMYKLESQGFYTSSARLSKIGLSNSPRKPSPC